MTLDALLQFAPALPGMPREFVPWCVWAGVPLEPGQARLARVAFDGAQPDPANPVDAAFFGEACAVVPKSALRTIALRFGRRSGKSHICAAYGIFRMVTGDVSMCGPGDEPAVGVTSTDKSEAGDVLAKALAIVKGKAELRVMLRAPNQTGFHLVRSDGVRVRFIARVTTAKGRGGRSKSWLAFVIDEAEFVDPGDPAAAARVEDLAVAVRPGLKDNGAVILCSTPWPAESYMSKLFDANFGKPVHALCAFGPTLMMRDTPELRAARDTLMAADPARALLEFDCIVTDVAGAFFEASTIDAAVSATTPRARMQRVSAGVDLAFIKDMAGLVIVERQIVGATAKVVVTAVDVTDPRREPEAKKPNVVVSRFVAAARELGAQALIADGHFAPLLREHAANPDVAMAVVAAPTSPADQSAAEIYMRDLFREGLIVLPSNSMLVGQLKSVLAKAMPGGLLRAVPPRRAGVGHCDLFVALRNAVWHDRRHGPLLRGATVATSAAPGVHTLQGGYDTEGWT
jgi:hypothetical protein